MKKYMMILCLLTSCCTIPNGKGIVVEKQHFQPYWEFADYGTPGIPSSMEIYHSEEWWIMYEYEGCRKHYKVNRIEWRDCKEGQHFYKEIPNCRDK